MSTRRQTRRAARRLNRLSDSNNSALTVNDDVSNDTHGEQSVEHTAPESNTSTQNHTPAPKRAANEVEDIELGAAKPQQSEPGTPNVRMMLAAGETVTCPQRNNVPLMHALNDNSLARWEAVVERLAMSSPVAAKSAPTTQAVIKSNEQAETSKITEVSTNDLCDEMMRRLSALSNRSECEKRQAAKLSVAMTTISDIMAALRNDKKAQKYLNDVSSEKIGELQAEQSNPANQAQESTGQTACKILEPSQLILGSISPTDVRLQRNLNQVSSNNTKIMTQPSRDVNEKNSEQDDLVRERGRKRQRSITPTTHRSLSNEMRRHRRRDESDERADKIVIPKFDGKDWPAFKSVFESVAAHKKWRPSFKALQLKCSITGAARAALNVLDSSEWSYEQLVDHLELRHGRNRTKVEVMEDLDKLTRKPSQSLTSWRDEVINVVNCGKLTGKQYRTLITESIRSCLNGQC